MPSETHLATACPLDCPDSCSLSVTVEGSRIREIAASPANPVTRGFLCDKVRRFDRHLYSDRRVAAPALRAGAKGGGAFHQVTWDEALGRLALELRTTARDRGGEAILPLSYGGSNGLLSQDTADALLFRRLGASQLARTVCAAPTGAAAGGLYGKMPGVAYTDYPDTRLIVVWGANPSSSGIHLVPPILEAQRNGAKLVVVDPLRTPLAARADLHLPLLPGTDLPLALAVIGWLFETGQADLPFLQRSTDGWEELARRAKPWTLTRAAAQCGLPESVIESFAELYAATSPAVVRCGWGLERNRHGGSAVAAVLALPAVAGKFGVRGGGFTMSNSAAIRFDSTAWLGEGSDTRTVNMNRVGEALERSASSGIHLLLVYNCNPLATLPNQERVRSGLLRDDLFTVVFDQVWTDTARYADLVLPATTFLEHDDLARGYGSFGLQSVRPVVPAVGEARSNLQVFGELLERLGLWRPEDPRTVAEWRSRILGSSPDVADLEEHLVDGGLAFPAFGCTPIQMVDVRPRTADGRIHLVPAHLDAETPAGLYHFDAPVKRYPLGLISPARRNQVSSTFGQLDRRTVPLLMHPQDATARNLASGERIRVFNELGEVHCRLRVDDATRPGVVVLPKGLWSHHTDNGRTANALAPDHLSDLGGGACFNDARVEVEALRG